MTDIKVSSDDVVIAVPQPSVPPNIVPPKIGLIEINQIIQRGSMWFTGSGFPTTPGGQVGDMYLDVDTGDIYQWNGTEWIFQGTFAPTTLTPEEILAMLITVDGDGSALDADLLDGQHGAYYATQADIDVVEADNAAQDAQLADHETRITSNTNNISAIGGATTDNTADIVALETALSAEVTARTNADTAHTATDTSLQTQITTEKNRNDSQDTAIAAKIGEAPNDGQQYVRKNLSWQPVSVPPGTIVSDTAPANPPDNQMWFESDTGNLYIWYRDADGAQWVMLAPGLGYTPPDLSGYQLKTAKPGNRFPNPCMQISQENGTNLVTTSGAYPADQCMVQAVGIAIQARNDNQQVSPDKNGSYASLCASTAKPTLAAADFMALSFPIEGMDVADLMWGTGDAVPAVLRFNAYAFNAGKYAFSIINAAGDRSFVGSFDIAAFTPTRFEFAIPAPPSGTWPKDNTLGLAFRFCPAAGSNYVGVAGWQTGNKLAPPGCYNGAAVANQTVYVTDIGLYADPDNTGKAPAFDPPLYGDALARCQRYWRGGNYSVSGYMQSSGSNTSDLLAYPVTMRVAPTISNTVTKAPIADLVISSSIDALTVALNTNGTGSGSAYAYGTYKANARMI